MSPRILIHINIRFIMSTSRQDSHQLWRQSDFAKSNTINKIRKQKKTINPVKRKVIK